MKPTILSFTPSLFVAIAAGPTPTAPPVVNIQAGAQSVCNTGSRVGMPQT